MSRIKRFSTRLLWVCIIAMLLPLMVVPQNTGKVSAAPLSSSLSLKSLLLLEFPDICAIFPSGPAYSLNPGVGQATSDEVCILRDLYQDRKWNSITIERHSDPKIARDFLDYIHSERTGHNANQPTWIPVGTYGDEGYAYDIPGKKDSTGVSTFVGIEFVRGCYSFEGNAGDDSDPAQVNGSIPRDLGPLRDLAITLDRALQKLPYSACGGGGTAPPIPPPSNVPANAVRLILPATDVPCAKRGVVAGTITLFEFRTSGDMDNNPPLVPVFTQTGKDETKGSAVNRDPGAIFPVQYGTEIRLPADASNYYIKASIELQGPPTTQIVLANDKRYLSSGFKSSFKIACGPDEPAFLDGVINVFENVKSEQAAGIKPQDIELISSIVNAVPEQLFTTQAFGKNLGLSPTAAQAQAGPQTFDTRYSVDTTDPARAIITVSLGNVRVTPKNTQSQPVIVKTGQRVEVSQSSISPPAQVVDVPGFASRTFPETGNTAKGLFLEYWYGHGSLAQQGYPISGLIREKSALNGQDYTVQYYERAVFEFHPEFAPPNDVLLSQLGTFQFNRKYPYGPATQKANQANANFFKETGHWVGGRFWQYWQSHGGLAQQGYPLSEEFTEISDTDGKPYLVQYFERAVFEYHPEFPPPNDVLLSLLGVAFYNQKYGAGIPPTPAPLLPTATRAAVPPAAPTATRAVPPNAPTATRTVPPPPIAPTATRTVTPSGPPALATRTSAGCVPRPSGMLLGLTGDGTTADSSGNNNNGVQRGSATYASGKAGPAFSFNGTTGYIEVPDNPAWAFGTNDFTIDLWVNFAHVNGNNAMVASDQGPGIFNKWIFWINGGFLQLHVNGPYAADIGGAQFQPNPGEWHHVAVTRGGSTFTFYIDGISRSTASESRPIPDASGPLTIGQAEGQFFVNGLQDEVHIFSRALSGSEIQAIYNSNQAGMCP